MPHLEAVTVVVGSPVTASVAEPVAPGEYRWRLEVPLNRPVRLGRDPDQCYLGVPSDVQISRFHATLTWTGTVLQVERRGIELPDHPEETKNEIRYRGARNDKFEIRVGDSFQIGQTTFSLRPSDETLRAAPVDVVPPQQVSPKSRGELQEQEFSNRELLRAVYRLPDRLAAVQDEDALYSRVLRDVEDALPRADAVAIVRRPPYCPPGELAVQVLTHRVRARPGAPAEFRPSRKLVKKAVCEEERSCMCVWPLDRPPVFGAGDITLPGPGARPGSVPWAVCTPFQDDSQYALYLAGAEDPQGDGLPDPAYLRDCQKFAELVVKIAEAARHTIRLRQQLELARLAWPTNLRPLLNDPASLRELLREPKEAEITVLFCDLRGYSKDAEAKGTNLRAAFAEVQRALDVMSSAVTDNGGIVAGFRGDAILGFWGWPNGSDDQIARAASAAVRIFTKLLGPINQRKCGLGLTHGTALAGRLGAHDLANVDLYGPVVNLAFRLEEMTKAFGTGIVVSDDIATHVRNADPTGARFRARPLGIVRPRGVNNALPVHELVPREPVADYPTWLTSPAYTANLRLWKVALELFTKGDWTAAYAALDDRFDSDPAAKYLMKLMRLSNKTPPIGWDGIHTPKPLD